MLLFRPFGVSFRECLPAAVLLLLAGCVTDGENQPPAQRTVLSENLLGLTPAGLARTLGMPQALRRDSPAQIWQYRGQDCVLDVFLYEMQEGAHVVHLEARNSRARPMVPQLCLGDMTSGTGT